MNRNWLAPQSSTPDYSGHSPSFGSIDTFVHIVHLLATAALLGLLDSVDGISCLVTSSNDMANHKELTPHTPSTSMNDFWSAISRCWPWQPWQQKIKSSSSVQRHYAKHSFAAVKWPFFSGTVKLFWTNAEFWWPTWTLNTVWGGAVGTVLWVNPRMSSICSL